MESIRKYLNDDNINDRQKINGILRDILSDDLTKVNMLMMAYDINIAKMLYEKEYTQGLFDACVDSMVNKCGFRENYAKNIVGAWCKLLEIDEILEINTYSVTKSKYCFLRHFNNNYPIESIREVEKIIFTTEVNVVNIYGNKVEFDENRECELKVNIINNELYFYTNAQKFVISDSIDENGFFSNFKYITNINGLNNIDISHNKNLNNMFYSCEKLRTLDFSKWDVSNVEDMHGMFSCCESLELIDVSKWDVSNVEDMRGMFSCCESLKLIDVSKWDVSNVNDMSYMFQACKNLMSIDVSKWKVKDLIKREHMFRMCNKLYHENIKMGDYVYRWHKGWKKYFF